MLCDVAQDNVTELRYLAAAWQLAWTAIAELTWPAIAPEEADQARNAADNIWQRHGGDVPRRVVRRADLPVLRPASESKWHKDKRARVDLSAGRIEGVHTDVPSMPTMPFHPSRPRLWPGTTRHIGMRSQSIPFFKRSAESRNSDQSFDWFHIAMVHHELGNRDEAKNWFDRAAAALGEGAPAELIELRAESRARTGQFERRTHGQKLITQ